ncbi:MAG: GntR family transcriptional regulator [Rhodobacteraceae bacterium]|nr:GntR family transcriptional regulator [Paracoccaceae bacterium]
MSSDDMIGSRRASSRNPTIAERAYGRIEELIVTLDLPPGALITETVLMERTGFGRTPIREALLRLAEDGLIRILPRRGIVITDVDIRSQLLLLELRREVERLIARRAAIRSGTAQRRRFREMSAEMRRARDADDYLAFLRVDSDFNRFSAECCGNPYAMKTIGSIHALSRRFWSLHAGPEDLGAAAPLHATLMDAIAEGDETAAAEASDRLMDYVEAFTRSTLPG